MLIDIRSDTVTRPTPAMRKAMAEADVGDDVYGDDPTVNYLETLAAQKLGKEAALFVPTGTFGNQLALFTWCQRGTEVIIGENSHIVIHEAGAPAVIAGVQLRCVPDPGGVLCPGDIKQKLRRQDLHAPATSLICMENAHSSGKAVSLKDMEAVAALAGRWELPVHLDGARIFNAAAALNCEAKEIAALADSVMFCLSKGLCAPVGSILAGTKEFIDAARLKRKIMGGGMRQAGVLAAAGIIALEEHSKRLPADHERAKKLAKGLSQINGINVNVSDVEINMVFFNHTLIKHPEQEEKIVRLFEGHGIIISLPHNGMFRFAVHYWIGDAEIEKILDTARKAFA